MKKIKLTALCSLAYAFIASLTLTACPLDKYIPEIPGINNPSADNSSITDETAPVITVEGEKEYLVPFGATFTLPKITALDDVDSELTHSVKVYHGEEEITLDNYSFVADKAGEYTIEVVATDKSGNQAKETLSVKATSENEINSFDDQLRIDNVKKKGFVNLSLNTDPSFIRYGEGSLKMEIVEHTALGWPGVIVQDLPISDISDYYSLSFWLYNDGTDDITIYLHRNEVDKNAKQVIAAKTWTKVEIVGRKYDNVFSAMPESGLEPEVGTCDDLKCFTFHFVNPANTSTFNLYMDDLIVNTEPVYDTLDIEADVQHPVKGVAYTMPDANVYFGGEEVEAEISYKVYDEKYNEIALTDNSLVFEKTGKYILSITAEYSGLISTRNYMIVCAQARAENEIEFFESADCLNFFTSPHLTVSYNTQHYHNANNSTGSLKIHSTQSVWPYVVMNDLPHADLENVAYIYFYAKTDYEIQAGQKAYLGIRDGGRGKVLSRLALSNDWQCFAFTKEQLANLGVTTLNGLQFSVELYDLSNPVNQGGWCPVLFNTYIDNFSIGTIAEPTEKEENVVLDFANYRDLDGITSSYTTFNFSDLDKTLNGLGSMKVSAAAKWPEMTFGSYFSKFSLDGVKNLVVEAFVPYVAEGHYVRIGANDSNYQRVTAADAGKWVSLYIPVEALLKTGTGTLENVKLNLARHDGTTWINLDDVYIGKIWLDYEGKPQVKPEKVEFTGAETAADLYMFSVKNDQYECSLTNDSNFVIEGANSIQLKAIPRWPSYYFTQQFIDWLTEKGYETFTFEMYIDNASSKANVTMTEGAIYSAAPVCDQWVTVTLNVADLSTKTYLQFNKNVAEALCVYIDNFKFYMPNEEPENPKVEPDEPKDPVEPETPEPSQMSAVAYDFNTEEQASAVVHAGNNVGQIVELGGDNALKFVLTSGAWSAMYLATAIDEKYTAANVNYLYLELYIDATLDTTAGDFVRFTYYTWNGTAFAEKFIDSYIQPKTWTTVRIPVLEGTPKLSEIKFLFPMKRSGTWSSIGQAEGEALYIKEIGVIANNVALSDFTGAESNADLAMFSVKNEDYRVMLNSNSAFVKEGNSSLRLTATPKWPQFFFTEGFINWLKAEGYTSFTFEMYIDGSSGNTLTGVEGVISGHTKLNEWQTVTVDVSTLVAGTSKIQINKNAATAMDIYLDNFVFIK